MKTACFALALSVPSAAFLTPMANVRPAATGPMAMSASEPVSRSQAISNILASGAAAVAAAAVPNAAFADGAKSLATQARARGIYGGRIEALKPAVDAGDMKKILNEQNVFALFNSGVYSTDKGKFAKAEELAKAVVFAAKTNDASALKSAYGEYMALIEQKSGFKGAGEGQGFGSEFDYKARTPMGTVYQR